MGSRDPFERPKPERGYGIVLVFALLAGALYLVWLHFGSPTLEVLRALGIGTTATPAVSPVPIVSFPAPEEGDPAFRALWERFDRPVLEHQALRDLTWGDKPIATFREPYSSSPGGSRLVQYYAKGRMEVTNPAQPKSDPWYVSSGLLVREMLSGKIEIGPGRFENRSPAQEPLFGEPMPPRTVTYSSLARVVTLLGNVRVDNKVGRPIYEKLAYDGTIEADLGMAVYDQRYGEFDREGNHNVARAFVDLLSRIDLIYENGTLTRAQLYTVRDIGVPISEPYWIRVTLNGRVQDALVQAFERRVLVFLPEADEPKVRIADSGLHYLAWRYGYRPNRQ